MQFITAKCNCNYANSMASNEKMQYLHIHHNTQLLPGIEDCGISEQNKSKYYVKYNFFFENVLMCENIDRVKTAYKGISIEPENVTFMSSCPLYIGCNYMHYSLMGNMKLICFIEVPFKADLTVSNIVYI